MLVAAGIPYIYSNSVSVSNSDKDSRRLRPDMSLQEVEIACESKGERIWEDRKHALATYRFRESDGFLTQVHLKNNRVISIAAQPSGQSIEQSMPAQTLEF